MRLNTEQMRDRSGPFYEHWARQRYLAARRKIIALNGALLVDSNERT